MTIVREYGPFKGIHNATNNLTAKQNYVLDSKNCVVNQDNGDIEKRPAMVAQNSLADCYGITRFITSQIDDGDKLFIAGSECKTLTAPNVAPVACADFLGAGSFPARSSNDFFSSFMYGGNLYFNYGGRIYKYDGKNVQPAGIGGLLIENSGVNSPQNFIFRVFACDDNMNVASIFEKEVLQLGFSASSWKVSLLWDSVSGVGIHNRFMVMNTASLVSILPAATFQLDYTQNTLIVGDKVFISVVPTNQDAFGIRAGKRLYDVFEVSAVDTINKKVTFLNPRLHTIGYFGQTDDSLNWLISPFMIEIYQYKSATGVYQLVQDSSLRGAQYCIVPTNTYSVGFNAMLTGFLTDVYEYPEFRRKILPLCKHISQVNGLMFMCCPKVTEGLTSDDTDYQWQTLAWSSENPTDPIETWGGMSAIIGTEDEGRLYACVPNNGALVLFKQRALYISAVPSDGLIEVQKVVGSSVGCSHPESIQECNGILFFYVEGKGIYMFRAGMAQAQEASGNFRGIFKTLTGVATSTHDIKKSRYLLNVGTMTFVYDYLLDSWWIWDGFNANKGYDYFQDQVVGVSSTLKQFVETSGLADNFGAPTAIDAYVLTNWFAGFDPETDKKLKALRLWSLNGSDGLVVDVYKNFRNTTEYTMSMTNATGVIDIGDFARAESGKRKFKAIAFKISNAIIGQNMKITGWAIDYEPTGIEPKNSEGAR